MKAFGVMPSDVEIEPNWTKRPFAKIDGIFIDHCITITHSGDLALAAVADSPVPKIGIDLERIEERTDGFLSEAFAPAELKELMDAEEESVSEMWSRKEAALKALGMGISATGIDKAFQEIEVTNGPSGKPSLLLTGWIQKISRRKRIGQITVSISHSGNYAVSTVMLAGSDNQ